MFYNEYEILDFTEEKNVSELNNEDVEVNVPENEGTEMCENSNHLSDDSGFQLGLFLKVGAILLFLYGVSSYLWDNYIRAWWNGTASDGLKRIIFWVIFLSVTGFVYNLVKNDKNK